MKKRLTISKKALQKEIELAIRKKVGKSVKSQKALMESQLKEVESGISSLLTEVEEGSRNHILENQNNIFTPVLDEATGETNYEARNFDEYLEECANDNSKTDGSNFDHIYEMLDESFDYEKQFYFGENLDSQGFYSQKQEQDNMTLEDVKRTIREQEEEGGEKKKGFFQRAKEKVSGAVKGAKETFKKSKLVFFLKIVQMGLKTALVASKSVFSLVIKFAAKMAKNFLAKLAAGKMKVSAMWATVKQWGAEKLGKFMEKIMSPFMWIAKKMTSSTAEAAEVAPLLFSITIMSLTLAYLYVSGGVGVFTSFTDSLSGGAAEVLESGGEELVGQVCAEAKMHNGQILSGQLLIEQGCGILDAQGNEISYDVAARVMKSLGAQINENLDQAQGITITHYSKYVEDVGDAVDTLDVGGHVDAQASVLSNMQSHFNGVMDGIRNDGTMRMEDLHPAAQKALQAEIAAAVQVGAKLPQIGEEGVRKLVDGMQLSHAVDSVLETADSAVDGVTTEITKSVSNVKIAGVTGLDEEVALTESRFRRFQELAGVKVLKG